MNWHGVSGALAFTGAILASGASQVTAGNIEDALVTPEVISPVVTKLDLSGFYAGGNLGYAIGVSDRVGHTAPNGNLVATPGTLHPEGLTYGVRLGWRNSLPLPSGKRQFVYGFELGYDLADIEDSFSTASYVASSEINNVLSLRYKGGITNSSENTLFYSLLGYARYDMDYNVTGATGGQAIALDSSSNEDGFQFGLGVERAINQDLSVLFEWEYNYIDSFTLRDSAGASTVVTPSFHNLRLGLNYSF